MLQHTIIKCNYDYKHRASCEDLPRHVASPPPCHRGLRGSKHAIGIGNIHSSTNELCMCVCIYIYIYIHTYIHMYIYIYIYMHTYIHTYMYTHMYISLFLSLSIYVYTVYAYTYIHTYMCMYIYIYIYIEREIYKKTLASRAAPP